MDMNPNEANEHLYTSATHPYFRAPHIYVALPTRFHPDRGNATDIMFMTSRGGDAFDRTFKTAFLRTWLWFPWKIIYLKEKIVFLL